MVMNLFQPEKLYQKEGRVSGSYRGRIIFRSWRNHFRIENQTKIWIWLCTSLGALYAATMSTLSTRAHSITRRSETQ